MQKSLRRKDSRLGFGLLILFGISLVIPKFRITRLSALQDPEKDSEIRAALSLRVKQGVITAVGVFVDFAVPYTFKAPGTGQSFAETADAGEHVYELDQGHNSLWGCLPDLRRYLIGAPHQKQKQPVIDCTKQDFFTVHNV